MLCTVVFIFWVTTSLVERIFSRLLRWREAVDRWEFKKFLSRSSELTADVNTPLFGFRASTWQRFRSIRQALANEVTEINNGQRPVR
jgi:hypothetical protein